MPLTLTRRDADLVPVDFRGTTPDAVRAESLIAVKQRLVRHGNRCAALEELCDVNGDPRDGRWRLQGDWSRVHGVGAGMRNGEIEVAGSIGPQAGAEMRGGRIIVAGDAGDWLGAEMRGGLIQVRGNAGDHVAAARLGSRRGMEGGAILIEGNVGDHAGSRMRRGLLAVGGDAGEWLARQMLAGTVLVWGACGAHLAADMIRGTVALLGPAPTLGPTFQPGTTGSWPMVALLNRELSRLHFSRRLPQTPLRIVHGDFLRGGRGEVFVAA